MSAVRVETHEGPILIISITIETIKTFVVLPVKEIELKDFKPTFY